MKVLQKSILLQILTLPIGVGLFIWLLGRQDWHEISQQFQSINFWWGIPILGVTITNYIARALRWQLLLPNYSFATVLRALLIGYWVNLALPRMGEVARVWALQKNKTFLWEGLGTVVIERILDLLCLGAIIALFLATYDFHLYFTLPALLKNGWIITLIIFAGLTLTYILYQWLQKTSLTWLKDLQKGLSSLWAVRRQGHLWAYTFLIWWTYLAMSYYWFFALPATTHLGWNVAFAMVALGTLSRILPLQANSAGAYHNLVVMALTLFGVAESPAFALTFLIHTSQLLFTILVGGICWIWLSFTK